MIAEKNSENRVLKKGLVWDIPVRLVHWVIVLALCSAYVTNQLGLEYYQYHLISGYTVIVAVLFRILWGIWGTVHARFKSFIRGPKTALDYAKGIFVNREQHYVGHNPLGAFMIVVLLFCLLGQSASGLFTSDEIFNFGPLYSTVSDSVSAVMGTIHRTLFYWLAAFVVFHVAAVFFHWVIKKENLIKAMITGKKVVEQDKEIKFIESSRLGLAVVLFFLVVLLLYLILKLPDVGIPSL